MTTEEMITTLHSVLDALYQSNDPIHYQEILVAAEDIAGALRYDFGVSPHVSEPIPHGEYIF